jgi:hypothetical protein
MVRKTWFMVGRVKKIIPELVGSAAPKAPNNDFSMRGNSGEIPEKTLHEFV